MTRKRRPQRHAIAPYTQHGELPETNPHLAAAILEIVDTQLRDGTPKETRQTFDRLLAGGLHPRGRPAVTCPCGGARDLHRHGAW
jgi:hypothetical protein